MVESWIAKMALRLRTAAAKSSTIVFVERRSIGAFQGRNVIVNRMESNLQLFSDSVAVRCRVCDVLQREMQRHCSTSDTSKCVH